MMTQVIDQMDIRGFHASETFGRNYHEYSEGLFIDAAALLKEGDIAIDAGCFVGENALAFARAVGVNGKVYTFEPDPRLYKMTVDRLNTGEAGASSIVLNEFALGDKNGDVQFHVKNEIMGHSGLVKNIDADRPDVTFETIYRQIKRLDDFLVSRDVDLSRVKGIKYDLEGAELNALNGTRATIGAGQPLIMFEYARLEGYGLKPHDYFDFFSSINYQIVTCYDTDIVNTNFLTGNVGWNLFAVPRSNPFLRGHLSRIIRARLPWLLEREEPIV